jgi:hypothetical protein
MKTRLLIFAVVGPVASLVVFTVVTALVSVAEGGTLSHALGQSGRILLRLISPPGLVILLILAAPSAGAGALSRLLDRERKITRLVAGTAALVLIAPGTLGVAYFVYRSALAAAVGGLIANGVALYVCWALARANERLSLRPALAAFD